ncbi:NDR1/HIN1-like protein 13 [Magnolia sinica]|uniref:NDR1/HIN1-like protein 13 n=1 Tax=Magnolia sinica TaxID=86752 RepID=UPI0026588C15|nr:NDR1/HIN1-like protein 13 [Magnolia sinica]
MLHTTPPQSQTTPTSLPRPPNQNIKTMKQDIPRLPAPPAPSPTRRPKTRGLLRPPRRTNAFVWCAAFACVIFSILLILAGIATLIVFLVIKPRHPSFETTAASLNSIYLDTPEYFNGDLTFLANFSNPNHKMDVQFEYLNIELYFSDRLIATQSLQPFAQRRGEARLEAVHMISSEVYLPLKLSMELQKQVQSNRVQYNIRGTFRVRANLGLSHFSYWLYGRCQIELTGPPSGVLVARSCSTKR